MSRTILVGLVALLGFTTGVAFATNDYLASLASTEQTAFIGGSNHLAGDGGGGGPGGGSSGGSNYGSYSGPGGTGGAVGGGRGPGGSPSGTAGKGNAGGSPSKSPGSGKSSNTPGASGAGGDPNSANNSQRGGGGGGGGGNTNNLGGSPGGQNTGRDQGVRDNAGNGNGGYGGGGGGGANNPGGAGDPNNTDQGVRAGSSQEAKDTAAQKKAEYTQNYAKDLQNYNRDRQSSPADIKATRDAAEARLSQQAKSADIQNYNGDRQSTAADIQAAKDAVNTQPGYKAIPQQNCGTGCNDTQPRDTSDTEYKNSNQYNQDKAVRDAIEAAKKPQAGRGATPVGIDAGGYTDPMAPGRVNIEPANGGPEKKGPPTRDEVFQEMAANGYFGQQQPDGTYDREITNPEDVKVAVDKEYSDKLKEYAANAAEEEEQSGVPNPNYAGYAANEPGAQVPAGLNAQKSQPTKPQQSPLEKVQSAPGKGDLPSAAPAGPATVTLSRQPPSYPGFGTTNPTEAAKVYAAMAKAEQVKKDAAKPNFSTTLPGQKYGVPKLTGQITHTDIHTGKEIVDGDYSYDQITGSYTVKPSEASQADDGTYEIDGDPAKGLPPSAATFKGGKLVSMTATPKPGQPVANGLSDLESLQALNEEAKRRFTEADLEDIVAGDTWDRKTPGAPRIPDDVTDLPLLRMAAEKQNPSLQKEDAEVDPSDSQPVKRSLSRVAEAVAPATGKIVSIGMSFIGFGAPPQAEKAPAQTPKVSVSKEIQDRIPSDPKAKVGVVSEVENNPTTKTTTVTPKGNLIANIKVKAEDGRPGGEVRIEIDPRTGEVLGTAPVGEAAKSGRDNEPAVSLYPGEYAVPVPTGGTTVITVDAGVVKGVKGNIYTKLPPNQITSTQINSPRISADDIKRAVDEIKPESQPAAYDGMKRAVAEAEKSEMEAQKAKADAAAAKEQLAKEQQSWFGSVTEGLPQTVDALDAIAQEQAAKAREDRAKREAAIQAYNTWYPSEPKVANVTPPPGLRISEQAAGYGKDKPILSKNGKVFATVNPVTGTITFDKDAPLGLKEKDQVTDARFDGINYTVTVAGDKIKDIVYSHNQYEGDQEKEELVRPEVPVNPNEEPQNPENDPAPAPQQEQEPAPQVADNKKGIFDTIRGWLSGGSTQPGQTRDEGGRSDSDSPWWVKEQTHEPVATTTTQADRSWMDALRARLGW